MRFLRTITLAVVLCACAPTGAFAEEPEDTRGVASPEEWSLSATPRPSERQKEAARWTPLLKNDIGMYHYEEGSVASDAGEGSVASITLKVCDLKPDLLVKLNAKYSYLLDEDAVSYMEQKLLVRRADRTFAVSGHKIFSLGGILLEDTAIPELKFRPIPEKSVVEAALEKIEEILSRS